MQTAARGAYAGACRDAACRARTVNSASNAYDCSTKLHALHVPCDLRLDRAQRVSAASRLLCTTGQTHPGSSQHCIVPDSARHYAATPTTPRTR